MSLKRIVFVYRMLGRSPFGQFWRRISGARRRGRRPPTWLGEIRIVVIIAKRHGKVGNLPLVFHFPTALFPHRGLRQRSNSASLAFCIRRAASVSLLAAACFCSQSAR
jgi:hypothetical protein